MDDQLNELVEALNQLTEKKAKFQLPEEVKIKTNEGYIYVNIINKVLNNYMVRIETLKTNGYRNIKELEPNIIDALYNKVKPLVTAKSKAA